MRDSQMAAMGNGAHLLRLSISGACVILFPAFHSIVQTLSANYMLNGETVVAQREALAFEWAWQHPLKSKAVREMAGKLKQREMTGVAGKVRGSS